MARLDIHPVEDEATAQLWHRVDAATRSAEVPADPLCEVLPRLRAAAESGERTELWFGLVDGLPVAAGELMLPTRDNHANATIDVRVVAEHRRRGHATTLLTHLLDQARAARRSRIFGEVDEPLHEAVDGEPPGRAFARALGARPVLTEVRRMLDLTRLDRDRLAALAADARTKAHGYSLVQWIDRAPDDVVEDFALLMGRMSTDVPLEDMKWEAEVFDVDRVRAKEDAAIARRRCRVVTAARHDATGRLVGYTDIGVNVEQPRVAYQWDTIVLTGHRGHRLGLLMKIANLELLHSTVPGAELVNTWNAEVNTHMIAVNEAIGFRPAERWREWQLDLPVPR